MKKAPGDPHSPGQFALWQHFSEQSTTSHCFQLGTNFHLPWLTVLGCPWVGCLPGFPLRASSPYFQKLPPPVPQNSPPFPFQPFLFYPPSSSPTSPPPPLPPPPFFPPLIQSAPGFDPHFPSLLLPGKKCIATRLKKTEVCRVCNYCRHDISRKHQCLCKIVSFPGKISIRENFISVI